MWLLYLIALTLGGGILLLQVLSGSGHDIGGHDGDIGFDHGADHVGHGPGLLSLRSITYGLFAFGLVGAALNVMVSSRLALAVAVASGILTTLGIGTTFRNLADEAASGEAGFHEAAGFTARVLVACEHGRRGKIRVLLKGQHVDMLATTDAGLIPVGSEVTILEVRDDVAHVEPKSGSGEASA